MQNSSTIYQFILDGSGSMSNVRKETLTNFNLHLQSIQKLQSEFPEQTCSLSLTIFNGNLTQVWRHLEPSNISPLTLDKYETSGNTALLDAIGTQIQDIQNTFGADIEANKASVVMIILTDGEENSSKFFDFPFISKTIKSLEETGNWTFTFLGADLDTFHVGSMLNIKNSNILQFDKKEMNETFNVVNLSLKNYFYNKQKGIKSESYLNPEEEI